MQPRSAIRTRIISIAVVTPGRDTKQGIRERKTKGQGTVDRRSITRRSPEERRAV